MDITEGMTFTFSPPLSIDDVVMEIVNSKQIALTLKRGKKWRADPGFIAVKSIEKNSESFKVGNADGINVAHILIDPVIFSNSLPFVASQSRLEVVGYGFTNIYDSKITFKDVSPDGYKMLDFTNNHIMYLKPVKDWLSIVNSPISNDAKYFALEVVSIDTGAGDVVLPDPITVGYIFKNRESVICEDSYKFSYGGICDDPEHLLSYIDFLDDDDTLLKVTPLDHHRNEVNITDDYFRCQMGTDCTDCLKIAQFP